MGEIDPTAVQVEMFAEEAGGSPPDIVILHRQDAIPGSMNGYLYAGATPPSRPLEDYTARVVPYYPGAHLPNEMPLIAWQK